MCDSSSRKIRGNLFVDCKQRCFRLRSSSEALIWRGRDYKNQNGNEAYMIQWKENQAGQQKRGIMESGFANAEED